MLHTFVGNLVEAPTFTMTERGIASVRLRLAVNEAYRDKKGELREKDPTFWDCYAWGIRAERIRDAAWRKGQAVIVVGEFTSSSWMSEDGAKHTRTTVTILNVGADALALGAPRRRKPRLLLCLRLRSCRAWELWMLMQRSGCDCDAWVWLGESGCV